MSQTITFESPKEMTDRVIYESLNHSQITLDPLTCEIFRTLMANEEFRRESAERKANCLSELVYVVKRAGGRFRAADLATKTATALFEELLESTYRAMQAKEDPVGALQPL